MSRDPTSPRTPLQRASDGFLPEALADRLYVPAFRVGPTDVNGWSIVHAIAGAATRALTPNVWDALLLHSAWEAFQFVAGDNRFDLETAIDVTLDTLFFVGGYKVATQVDSPSKLWLLLLIIPIVPPL